MQSPSTHMAEPQSALIEHLAPVSLALPRTSRVMAKSATNAHAMMPASQSQDLLI